MTFLNPLVLFGLVAATIPVILHLFNLRKLRTVEFSTLTFLKELQRTKIRRLKLRQLLLLIVRTLLVIFIVLAFARPALRGTILGGRLGSEAHSSIVLILDDSFSMSASDEHGEYFKQAQDATAKLIDLLKNGDEVFVIKLSDLPEATVNPATHDFAALRTLVNESRVSGIRRPIDEGLRLAGQLLQRSRNPNKEIYIVSDMQRTLFAQSIPERRGGVLSQLDNQTKMFLVLVGNKDAANVAVDSVSVQTTILEKDKLATVFASVRNYSSASLNNYVASVYLDGAKAAQRSVGLEPWGSASLEFSVTPKKTGFVQGWVELENDAIESDNRRYFTMYVPERINVAVVSSVPADDRYLLLALGASATEGSQSLINIQQTTLAKFPLLDLKSIDVLVCTDIAAFSSVEADRVKQFVDRGGGLVLFPGSATQQSNSSALLAALNIPQPDGIIAAPDPNAGLSFQNIDLDHPLFATLFEKDRGYRRDRSPDVESPHIVRALHRQPGREGQTIITMSDGSPFLSEHTLGIGRILFYSIAPVATWSDFPLKALFAPLLYRSVVYVSPREEYPTMYTTGSEPTITLRKATQVSSSAHRYSVALPDGTEELIQPTTSPLRNDHRGMVPTLAFTLNRLADPGFYELRAGSKPIAMIAANVDSKESDTRRASNDDLTSFWKRLGIDPSKSVRVLKPGADQLQAAILQTRYGIELWRYCVALALLLALTEMLIARDSRKALQET